MGLSKRDLTRKKKSLEMRINELDAKIKKFPLDKTLQQEREDLRRKLEKIH
ncbi:MAG: hypothetical protein M1166_05985 [Candidatus Thermoplasmatota archaeon]|jgi:uncharacterized protein YnzC (UPF0291/DUF896 family)|nr:hypothetical protein [Candidatus Thermoplasmatota archaeon]